MRRKIGNICTLVGAVLVLAALLLFVYNQVEEENAWEASQAVLPQLVEQAELAAEESEASGQQETLLVYPGETDPTMTEVEIDGYAYIGYLSIPSLDLELPILSEWDYTRLKISPCRYTGSTKTDNLVIAAHNYARHFGKISQLSQGATVIFTDMDGVVTYYQVEAVEILEPTAIEDMTSGAYDLTLFTCTYGGKSRVTVRCDRVD